MNSYIVRIYRQEGGGAEDGLVGIVEPVNRQDSWQFVNRDELWEILVREEERTIQTTTRPD